MVSFSYIKYTHYVLKLKEKVITRRIPVIWRAKVGVIKMAGLQFFQKK